jgi:Holliday junction resolvasome RuvABC endonuclease subunit
MQKKDSLLGLDLSLSCTGVCLFDNDGNPFKIFSIPTDKKENHGERLKTIAESLYFIKNKYNIGLVVLEKGFTRFNVSTQTIFKVVGLANYVFSDCPQIYYPSSTIRKAICGKGNVDKNVVEQKMRELFPYLKFSNQDESDACSVGYAYFLLSKSKNDIEVEL